MDATLAYTNPNRPFTVSGHRGIVIKRRCALGFHRPAGRFRAMCSHKPTDGRALRMNGDDGSKSRVRVAFGASMAMACVLGALCFARPAYPLWPWQQDFQVVQEEPDSNVRSALEKLMGKGTKMKDPRALEKFRNLLEKKRDYEALEETAGRLDMSDINEAVKKLNEEYSKAGNSDDAHWLGRLLVELLIYRGKYSDAKMVCDDMVVKKMDFDGRLLLFQAVLNLLLKNEREAKDRWDAYRDKCKSGPNPNQPPGDSQPDVNLTFDQFKDLFKKN